MGDWRTISIALEANVGGYINGLNRATKATADMGRETQRTTTATGASFADLAKKGAMLGGVALGMRTVVQAGQFMVGQAVSWESAFAGVTKTVDGTEAELAALSDGIIDMSNRIPASREAIASVAEAAGQLGIATPNVLGFTETMIGLGEATNLSATEAASQLARLANITQMSQSDFDRLGSAVVALGNNFATTEAEIVAMSLRIASAGTQVGLSEAQIAGLAAALSSVGIEAEAGGSAISRVMIDIATAVDMGGEKLATIADVAGMTAEQFAGLWSTDSAQALAVFVEGLGTLEARGQSMFAVMEQLGFADVRVGNSLRSLAGAGDLLARALGTSTDAWKENSALTEEVDKRYATAASQLKVFGNQISDVARRGGAELVPMILAAAKAGQDFARWAADMAGNLGDSGTWDNLVETGENLIGVLAGVIEAGAPIVQLLAGLTLGLAGLGLDVVAEALSIVSGLLEKFAPVLGAVAVGWLAYTAATSASTVAAALHSAAMTVQLQAMYAVQAAQGGLALSSMSAAGAVGVLAAALALGYMQYRKWQEAGRSQARDWFDQINEKAELTVESLQRRSEQALQLADALGNSLSTGVAAYTVDVDFNAQTSAAIGEAQKQFLAYQATLISFQGTAAATGLTTDQLAKVLAELEIDPATTSVTDMVAAVQEWATANGAATPSIAAQAQAVEEETKALMENVDAARERYDLEQSLVAAQRGVADAERGLADAHKQVATAKRGVTDAAKGVQDAYRGVQDAARGLQAAQKGVAEAQAAQVQAVSELAQAQRDALYGTKELEQANRGVTDAEQQLAQAQRDSLTAQEALDEARGRAARNLEDLDRAARGAAISEQRAELALAEARARAAEPAGEDDDASDARRRQLDIAAAELALEEARVRNTDAAARLQEAEDKGIEQSDAVVGAKDEIAAAAGREQDAEEALAEARARVVDVQEALAARVVEAQARVVEANEQVSEAHYRVEQAAYRVRDAQDAVGAAQQRLVDARASVVDAQRGVADAELAVTEAVKETADAQFDLDVKTLGAEAAINRYRDGLIGLQSILGPNDPLRAGLQGLIDQLAILNGGGGGSVPGPWSGGYVFPRRWGGIDHYAGGGIRNRAMIGSGRNMIWWDEPATGGELYAPRNGNPAQVVPYLREGASWYGYELTRRAPSGGMDAAMFAAAVAQSSRPSTQFPAGFVQVSAPQHATPAYIGEAAGQMVASKLLKMAVH